MTAIVADDVAITWTIPHDVSSEVTGYTVLIITSDLASFVEEPINCDGLDLIVHSTTSCSVPIAKLIVEPFNLPWGSSIVAKVRAINVVGASPYSTEGSGAIILTNPDAPYNLVNVPEITAKHQIGLDWESLTFSGGENILDFTISYAQGTDDYLVFEEGVTTTSFTATGLTTGVIYSFKVQARNIYGLSDYSNEV